MSADTQDSSSLNSIIVQDLKGDISTLRAEIERIKDEVNGVKLSVAGLSGEITHFAACFQELSATISEFIGYQREMNQSLLSNCNREERWQNRDRELTGIKDSIGALDGRITAIETEHASQKGGELATKPYRQFFITVIMTGITVAEGALIIFLLAKGGIT